MSSSADSSPMRFGSGNDLNFVGTAADPNFTAEISTKMRVPRKIRVGTHAFIMHLTAFFEK